MRLHRCVSCAEWPAVVALSEILGVKGSIQSGFFGFGMACVGELAPLSTMTSPIPPDSFFLDDVGSPFP